LGSIISTSNEAKKTSYLSCVELSLKIALVASLGITLLPGTFVTGNKSTSQPKVLRLFGFRAVNILGSMEIFELKKLFTGFTVLLSGVKDPLALISNPSPPILLSPSRAAMAIFAFT